APASIPGRRLPMGPGADLAPGRPVRPGGSRAAPAGRHLARRRDRALARGLRRRRSHGPRRQPAVPPGAGPGRSRRARTRRLTRSAFARAGGPRLLATARDRTRTDRLLALVEIRPPAPGGRAGRSGQGPRRGDPGDPRASRTRDPPGPDSAP